MKEKPQCVHGMPYDLACVSCIADAIRKTAKDKRKKKIK